jgi:hypothetical protein
MIFINRLVIVKETSCSDCDVHGYDCVHSGKWWPTPRLGRMISQNTTISTLTAFRTSYLGTSHICLEVGTDYWSIIYISVLKF